jgi:oligopeptide/dipeptide ABC transporter ATP-binding protein
MVEDVKSDVLIKTEKIHKDFPVLGGILMKPMAFVHAVDDVDLEVLRGETLGLVGESGCGKSTLGRLILKLEDPTSGTVLFEDEDVQTYDRKKMQQYRKSAQIIFQDPYSSLDPRKPIGKTIEEPLIVHKILGKKEARERAMELLELVGLRSTYYYGYPHEFSGGQRQRVGIARALSLTPKFIVCDEPISSLDVSVQAQIINLLQELQNKFHLTYLFISHDLSVVHYISNRVAVMYLGRIVEMGLSQSVYKAPQHPYTKALLSASPVPNPFLERKKIILKGDVPTPLHPPAGCHFHTRCPYRLPLCDKEIPTLVDVESDHWVRCFLFSQAC